MPFHKRDGKPVEDELVPEDTLQYLQLHDASGKPLDEWLHFDPATQKATKGPKPKAPKMIKTGGKVQVDLSCHDCGATLIAGGGWPFDFLICGRLRDWHTIDVAIHEVNNDGVVTGTRLERHVFADAPEPHAGSVIECDRYGLLPKDGPLGPAGRL